MKKILLIITATVVVAQAAFSQGTVSFANTGTFATTRDRSVYDVGGVTKLVNVTGGQTYVAALYWGTSADAINNLAVRSLTVAGDDTLARSIVSFRVVDPTTTTAGTWVGGTRFFNGADVGASLKLQIRVWDSSKFQSYGDALNGGGIHGESAAFDYTVAAAADAAGQKINNFAGLTLVPEPSTIALAVLGLGSLLLFRRRK